MRGLPEIQQAFQRGLFDVDAATGELPVKPNGLTPARRLQVYRNNVFSSLTDALKDVHPVVAKLVGDGFFAYCADTYIRDYPSTSGDLHRFGDRFADFLRNFAPAGSLGYLGDVAQLEWFYHEAFHAADVPPMDLEALATVDEHQYGGLIFELHPSVRLIRSDYPLLDIWRVNQDDYEGESVVDLDAGGGQWLVRRSPSNEVELMPLAAAEYVWFEQLAAGLPLQGAVEAALAVAHLDLDEILPRHVMSGVVCGFRQPGGDAAAAD